MKNILNFKTILKSITAVLLVATAVYAFTVSPGTITQTPATTFFADSTIADQGAATSSGNQSIKDFVDAIGATKKGTIYLVHTGAADETTYTLTTSETIPSNISLMMENGAIIDGAGTLTIDGPREWGLYKVFGSTITVSFATGLIKEGYTEWWGALGDGTTDDYSAFYATAHSGLSTIKMLGKTYRIDSMLDIGTNVSLIGLGIDHTVLDFSNSASNGIHSYGSTTELANLNANITKGNLTITLDDTPAVSHGDLIIIYDATAQSYSSCGSSGWNAGEFAMVDTVSGNDIDLASPVYASYTDDADMHIYKVNPTTFTMRDFTMRGDDSYAYGEGISVKLAYKSTIKNVKSYDYKVGGFYFRRSYDCVFDNVKALSLSSVDPQLKGHGFALGSCQDIRVVNSYFAGHFHGSSVNEDGGMPFPSRNIIFGNSHFYTTGKHAGGLAATSHGSSEYITYDNCIANGIVIGGNYSEVKNCIVYSEIFTALKLQEAVGYSHKFVGNTIYQNGTYAFLEAHVAACMSGGGTFIFNDNVCYMYDTTGSDYAFTIKNQGATISTLRVEMCNNTFSNLSGVEQNVGIVVAESGNYFESVKISNNTFNGYSLVVRNSQAVEVCNNQVTDGVGGFGLEVKVDAPIADPTIIKVIGNTIYNCEDGLKIIAGDAGNLCEELVIKDNIIKDNATSAGTRYELYVQYAAHAVIEGNVISGSNANLNDLVYLDNLTEVEVWNNVFETTLTSAWTTTNITTYRGQIVDNLADDAEVVLPTAPAGWVKAWGGGEVGVIQTTAAAACTLVWNTTNVDDADTDTDLCVYDKGATIGVKNRLGAAKLIHIEINE